MDAADRPGGGTGRRPRVVALGAIVLAVVVAVSVLLVLTRNGPEVAAAAPRSAPAGAAESAAESAAEPTTTPPGPGGPGWAPTTPNPTQWDVEQPVSGLTPVSVEIPDIGVSSDLLRLAVDGTGVLVPPDPYDVAGWFTGGPVPGDLGPAIIAGHVDSRAGPGVFFRLEEMEPGQKIRVTRSDASVATFTVRAVDSWPKTAFPTALVYGPTPDRELRLITCGGDFDRGRRSYVDNIVVFAVLDR